MFEWKLLSECPPPVGVPLIITVNDGYWKKRTTRYPVLYRKDYYADRYCFWLGDDNMLLTEYSEVVAWCEIPMPYDGEVEE